MSVKWAPYRAGPKAQKVEKYEIDKMLEKKATEMTKMEWAIQILSEPKKIAHLKFLWVIESQTL